MIEMIGEEDVRHKSNKSATFQKASTCRAGFTKIEATQTHLKPSTEGERAASSSAAAAKAVRTCFIIILVGSKWQCLVG